MPIHLLFIIVITHLFEINTVNSLTNMTLKETFELIWTILYFKYKRQEININDAFTPLKIKNAGFHLCKSTRFGLFIPCKFWVCDTDVVSLSKPLASF